MADYDWATIEQLWAWKKENESALLAAHRMIESYENDNKMIVAEILRRDSEPTTD